MSGQDLFIKQAKRSLPLYQPASVRTATPDLSDLPEPDKLRSLAGEIRQHTLDHLEHYLHLMRQSVTDNGGHFYLAITAEDARRQVTASLATEKCQVARREPSAVCDEIGYFATGDDSRDALVVGANFAIAETGQVCICREAIIQIPTRVVVCVLGIESILPRLADLAVMLKLLARSSIGRPMTASTEILGANRTVAFHVIFVDNGRSEILAGEHRSALRCIGCGACAAVCPVYREAGRNNDIGQTSPIAAVTSPLIKGLHSFKELPFASTLCGACSSACPVGIDLPWHLTRLRQRLVEKGQTGFAERFSQRLRAWAVKSPMRYRRLGAVDWKLGVPGDPPLPAAKTFHAIWKARKYPHGPSI